LGDTGFHLVTEVRAVGLLKGTNIVAFSWKAVAVDGASLTLTPLTNAGDVRLIGFTQPAGESGTLLAEVFADKDVVASFRVSYLLGNITRDVSYQGVLNTSGNSWLLKREATVFNRSGERFERIDVDLGSGLRHSGGLDSPEGRKVWLDTASAIPVKKVYRRLLTPMPFVGGAPQPLNPELYYVLVNERSFNPQQGVLSTGKIRLFQTDKAGTQAFLGEDAVRDTAFGEKAEIRGGGARDIRIKWFLDKDEDRNVVRARRSAQEPDNYLIRADRYRKYRIEVKNFKADAALVYVTIPVEFQTGVTVQKSSHPTEIERNYTDGILVKIEVPGGGKEVSASVELLYPDYQFNTY